MAFSKVIGVDIQEVQAEERRKRTNEFNPSCKPKPTEVMITCIPSPHIPPHTRTHISHALLLEHQFGEGIEKSRLFTSSHHKLRIQAEVWQS